MRISDWSSDVCSSDLPGSAAKAPNEFSRIVTPDRLGAPKLVESFEASPAERAAVARRLELLAVDRLAAELTVTNVGGRLFRVEGPWEAAEIGRASCRERVCQYGYIPVGARSFKKIRLIKNASQ